MGPVGSFAARSSTWGLTKAELRTPNVKLHRARRTSSKHQSISGTYRTSIRHLCQAPPSASSKGFLEGSVLCPPRLPRIGHKLTCLLTLIPSLTLSKHCGVPCPAPKPMAPRPPPRPGLCQGANGTLPCSGKPPDAARSVVLRASTAAILLILITYKHT